MLLEFRTKNYKSFKDELVFSMKPALRQKGLDYSILKEKIGSKQYKALCSAVIYGPNASGKTNIIGAMEVFRDIVLRGNIRNNKDKNTPNFAINALELIPNCQSKNNAPVEFHIKFIEKNVLFDYSLIIDIGNFLDRKYKRKIIRETLRINEKKVFDRQDKLSFGNFSSIKKYLSSKFCESKDSAIIIAENNLVDDELFLMNGFKAIFSSKLVSLITTWFDEKFEVVYEINDLEVTKKSDNLKEDTIYVDETINKIAKILGTTSKHIGYESRKEDSTVQRISVIDQSKILPAEIFESYGTIQMINRIPLIFKAIVNGGTLVIDEFDSSLHPMVLMSIINIFHNDDINKKKAQLIFNTHNPIFINTNLFRRDEIKFVDRDEENNTSIHYSLSDFGTSGSSKARNGLNYMKNYFISKYGAIKDIDFSPVFNEIMDDILDDEKEE